MPRWSPSAFVRVGVAASFALATALTSVACRRSSESRADEAEPGAEAQAQTQAQTQAKTPAEGPMVETQSGPVRGLDLGGAEVFRGLPYAAPPVGERRFRPPAPPPPWTQVRDATSFGERCPQPGPAGGVVGDEDCLSLNLWRPSAPADAPRPILVFIHGGANVIGSGADLHHNGRWLAERQGVIVVTINYRLGLLGFLAHPKLRAEDGGSGNWAYRDQIAALEWVQQNAAAFGGDPDRVTLAGQSAGALAACVLLASPLAEGLFSAAILQSGGCELAPLARREAQGQAWLGRTGCAAKPDPAACLRAVDAKTLVELAPPVPRHMTDWALPVGGAVDGVVVPKSPWQIFAAGEHEVVPTLVGTTADETELFAPRGVVDCPSYERAIQAHFPSRADTVLDAYPCADFEGGRQAYVAATTDALFTCPARRILEALAPAAEAAGVPLYRYRYDYVRSDPAVRELKAFHGAEIQLVFATMERFGLNIPPAERELSTIMQRSWAAMARDRSPVHDATTSWAPWEPARDNLLIFDAPVRLAEGEDAGRCEFWSPPASQAPEPP